MPKDSIENELRESIDDIIAEDRKRIDKAYKRIKEEVTSELQHVIEVSMLEDYYSEYDPTIPNGKTGRRGYNRQYQLQKSLWPDIDDVSMGNTYEFSFGIEFGPERMKHFKFKGKGEAKHKAYSSPEDEIKIFDNFMDGVHPNGVDYRYVRDRDDSIYNLANSAIDELYKVGGKIDGIIYDALDRK